ncbi:MAG TPA: hypothetical protein VF787_12520, partial [Thermoanaerobaculia bacterium]
RALRTSLLAGVALAIAALIVRALLIGYRPEFALAGMLFAGTTSYVAALFLLDRVLFHDLAATVFPRRAEASA